MPIMDKRGPSALTPGQYSNCLVKRTFVVLVMLLCICFITLFFLLFIFFASIPICPVPATVIASEQANDPSVKGLQKCFEPHCDKKLDSNSCDGVVGCYWCVRDKHDAPLDRKYCANINLCYGGKEGKKHSFLTASRMQKGTNIFELRPLIEILYLNFFWKISDEHSRDFYMGVPYRATFLLDLRALRHGSQVISSQSFLFRV